MSPVEVTVAVYLGEALDLHEGGMIFLHILHAISQMLDKPRGYQEPRGLLDLEEDFVTCLHSGFLRGNPARKASSVRGELHDNTTVLEVAHI